MLNRQRGLGLSVLAAGIACLSPVGAYAGWQEDLAREIRVAYRCEVTQLSKVVERDASGLRIVAATAHCGDGRKFTAGKIGEQPFIFDQCDAPGRRACP